MMHSHLRSSSTTIILILFVISTLLSCRTYRNVTYFKDIPDSIFLAAKSIEAIKFDVPKIQSNDILQISILTLDPVVNSMLNIESTSSFSVQPGAANAPTSGAPVNGFLVGEDGNIELPIVGKVKLVGLTTTQARDSIHSKVALYYKNPVVNVKFINFSITVLGEVAKPATYIVPNEKISVLDAIGMAGDLTIFGKRENILLVRDTVGRKQFIRFDLSSSAIIKSPYFYLKQGDLVYVEPNKSKVESIDVPKRNSTYALLVSLATLVFTVLIRL